MVVETVPKDILDKLGVGVAVTGTFWQGTQPVTQASTKTHNVYTFSEWLMENGTKVSGYAESGGELTTVYTVAGGKVLYILSLTLSYGNSAAAVNSTVYAQAGGINIVTIRTVDDSKEHAEVVSNFSPPLKLTAAQTVKVYSSNAAQLTGVSFVGYLVNA